MAIVCLVVMVGNRAVEPPREVQRMSCRLAINSMGRRSTGSDDDDEECEQWRGWWEGIGEMREKARWRGVKSSSIHHTPVTCVSLSSKQACKTNWDVTLRRCDYLIWYSRGAISNRETNQL